MKKIVFLVFCLYCYGITNAQDTTPPTLPTDVYADEIIPQSILIKWTAATDNIGVTEYAIKVESPDYPTEIHMASGNDTVFQLSTPYGAPLFISVEARDNAGNVSGYSNSVFVSTAYVSDPLITDVFISEYVELGGNNQAIELTYNVQCVPTNLCSVDLSNYSLRHTTAPGIWGTDFPLSGTFTSAIETLTIYNSLADDSYIDNAINPIDDTLPPPVTMATTHEALQFTGNEAIGLFKNGVLIDQYGTHGDTASLDNISSYRSRCQGVPIPATTWDSNDWTSGADPVGLGYYDCTMLLSTSEFDTVAFKVYPNPISDDMLSYTAMNEAMTISITDIRGSVVFTKRTAAEEHQINVSELSSGIYFARFTLESGTQTVFKIIKE